MNKAERFFLILAIILTIFLHSHYISGLYYEQDVALYANDALKIARGEKWYATTNWLNKPPGINIIFLLAFYILGESFISIQIFALIAKIISLILLYLFAKKILAKEVRLYFLLPLLYGLFSNSEVILGHTSNLETFLSPFGIAGILFLGMAMLNKKNIFYLLSGIVLGLGFLVKQSILANVIAGLIFIFVVKIVNKERFRVFFKKIFIFTSLFLVPLLLIFMYFLYLGVWRRFIGSVFINNIIYIKNAQILKSAYMLWAIQQIWSSLKIEIIIFVPLALIGIFYSLTRYKKPEGLLALSWFIIPAWIISIPGFHLRQHFLEMLPPFLTLVVIGISDIYNIALVLFQRKRFFLKIVISLGVCILVLPHFHLIFPLIKKHRLANSLFLTQRYTRSADKDKYVPLLLVESYDAARRFLISQYVKEHTDKKDKIFVWDGLATGSIYLWTQRDSVFNYVKFSFLPRRLLGPLQAYSLSADRCKCFQKRLLNKLAYESPVYIIVVQSPLPMPNAIYSYEQALALEKKAFKDFFGFLEKNYKLEKEIKGCYAYRLLNYNVK